MMTEKSVTIVNELGLHARPAADFVGFIKTFDNKVTLIKDNKAANAKSILHVLSLKLVQGATCVVRVEGDNAEEVLEKIERFIAELKE